MKEQIVKHACFAYQSNYLKSESSNAMSITKIIQKAILA